jgi:hypothetical protein
MLHPQPPLLAWLRPRLRLSRSCFTRLLSLWTTFMEALSTSRTELPSSEPTTSPPPPSLRLCICTSFNGTSTLNDANTTSSTCFFVTCLATFLETGALSHINGLTAGVPTSSSCFPPPASVTTLVETASFFSSATNFHTNR